MFTFSLFSFASKQPMSTLDSLASSSSRAT
jgi:hypothetical protein